MIFRVGHLDYTLRAMTGDDPEFGDAYGVTDTDSLEIVLDMSSPAQRQLEVLIHELAHAAWDAYGMPAKADEETVARFVGSFLASVLRANPKIMPILTALIAGRGFTDGA